MVRGRHLDVCLSVSMLPRLRRYSTRLVDLQVVSDIDMDQDDEIDVENDDDEPEMDDADGEGEDDDDDDDEEEEEQDKDEIHTVNNDSAMSIMTYPNAHM